MTTYLFVGWRRAAFEAAQSMGASVVLVSEKKPAAKMLDELSDWHVADFTSSEFDTGDVLDKVEAESIDAVVALTERAVLLAARLRQALGLPGNSVQTARQCRDKALMKEVVRDAGLLCADWVELTEHTEAGELIEQLGLPMVIKQRDSSGSRGTIIASTPQQVEDALQPGWMAEQFIGGEEMSVESIVYDQSVRFSNPTEYLKPGWANIVPADLDDSERAQLDAFNAKVITALQIERGICHLEVFRTSDRIYFGEIAVRPPGGRLIELISRAYDFDAWSEILRSHWQEPHGLPEHAQRYAGIWFLHPGPGTVADIQGVEEASKVAGVTQVKCRVDKGDPVGLREGTGQSVGHIAAEASSRAVLARALTQAISRISMPMARSR
jgi:biotin carboxylase